MIRRLSFFELLRKHFDDVAGRGANNQAQKQEFVDRHQIEGFSVTRNQDQRLQEGSEKASVELSAFAPQP